MDGQHEVGLVVMPQLVHKVEQIQEHVPILHQKMDDQVVVEVHQE